MEICKTSKKTKPWERQAAVALLQPRRKRKCINDDAMGKCSLIQRLRFRLVDIFGVIFGEYLCNEYVGERLTCVNWYFHEVSEQSRQIIQKGWSKTTNIPPSIHARLPTTPSKRFTLPYAFKRHMISHTQPSLYAIALHIKNRPSDPFRNITLVRMCTRDFQTSSLIIQYLASTKNALAVEARPQWQLKSLTPLRVQPHW